MYLGKYKVVPAELAGTEFSSIEYTGKLVLDESILIKLTSTVNYSPSPMLFSLTGAVNQKVVHLGYPLFRHSPELDETRQIVVPSWCSKYLGEQTIELRTVNLPSGTSVSLRPHEQTDVMEWANPTAILNTLLRQFACLTDTSSFTIAYLGREYTFTVESLKPAKAVNIIECDMRLEFIFNSTDDEEQQQQQQQQQCAYEVTECDANFNFQFGKVRFLRPAGRQENRRKRKLTEEKESMSRSEGSGIRLKDSMRASCSSKK